VDEIGVRYGQIILFGRSLGSGPAVHLASQYPVGGLILVSAFSSIKGAVQSIVGRFFAWTFEERFPNYRVIANVSCSTLFIHGERDGLIPAEHSLRLFKRCRARKLLITPAKMEHNSNLFGDASYLAVPAIHFFGFPGYYTSTPPRLPSYLFESPERRRKLGGKIGPEASLAQPFFCGCLAKSDPHHLEAGVEDITIRFAGGQGRDEATVARGGPMGATGGQSHFDLTDKNTSGCSSNVDGDADSVASLSEVQPGGDGLDQQAGDAEVSPSAPPPMKGTVAGGGA